MDNSPGMEYSSNEGHKMNFKDSLVLCQGGSYWNRLMNTAINIDINNFNHVTNFILGNCWSPIICQIRRL